MSAPSREQPAQALPVVPHREVLRFVWQLLRARSRPVMKVMVAHGIAAALGLVAPALLGRIVDAVVAGGGAGYVDAYALAIVAAGCLQAAALRHAVHRSAILGEEVLERVRGDIYRASLTVPWESTDGPVRADLLSRGSRDQENLVRAVRFAVPESVVAATSVTFLAGAVLITDVALSLIPMTVILTLLVATRVYLSRSRDAYRARAATYVLVGERLHEASVGRPTALRYGLHQRVLERISKALRQTHAAERRTLRLRSSWYFVVEMFYVLPIVVTLALATILLPKGAVTPGDVVAIVLYLRQIVVPLDDLLVWMDELQVAMASLARIRGVRAFRSPRQAPPESVSLDRIELDDVTYRYPDGRGGVDGVSLTLRPGEHLAIVGVSGSGKSTVGKLIAGLLLATAGHLDHLDRTGTPTAAPGRVVYVPHEPALMEGTIRENITFFVPELSDGVLWRRLAEVGAKEWVEQLPNGLESVARSADGPQLSDRQAQHLALARALAADTDCLVLDEALAVFGQEEALTLETLVTESFRSRMIVYIAHSISTAVRCDRVLVMADGHVVEHSSQTTRRHLEKLLDRTSRSRK